MAGALVKRPEGDLLIDTGRNHRTEERPWITRRRADTNADANSKNLLRLVALKERLPCLIIVPAHDIRAFAQVPKLPQTATTNQP